MFSASQRLCVASFAFFLSLCLATAGCSGSREATESTESAGTPDSQTETAAERCRKKLAAAIRRLDPETVALQEDPERSINGLNAWISSCAKDEVAAIELSEATLAMVGDSARATAGRYTANDGAYIRDCIVLRNLTEAISEHSGASLEEGETHADSNRIVAVFEWIVRHVSLISPTENRPPLALFDILLTGRGTPEDRAWIFGEALRQMQIDAVIISSQQEAVEGDSLNSANWLVAVFLETTSIVFDAATGIPITKEQSEDATENSFLSVSDLAQHDRWKSPGVQLIAQTSAFAPRMLVLQEQLAAEDSAILFEELTGGVSKIAPLVDRIKEAGNGLWTAEQIALWPYPEQQVIASNSVDQKQKKDVKQMMRAFQAPFERKDFAPENAEELTTVPEELTDTERQTYVQQRLMQSFERMMESSDELFGKPSNGLLKARVSQIQGMTDTGVIQQLQQVRIASMQDALRIRVPQAIQEQNGYPPIMSIPFPELIREVNQSSTGDSLYWTALCQMDREEYGTAIITLLNYRRQYPEGKWKYSTLINQALSLLQQERVQDATEILKEADVEANPERYRVQHLLKTL